MKVQGGIYLIADINLEESELFQKLEQALANGVSILQIYNTTDDQTCLQKVNKVCTLCYKYKVPVLVSNHWEILLNSSLDGVHFDDTPKNIEDIEQKAGRKLIKGITAGNDLATIAWAEDHNFDYVSFCSMFPSPSAGACEIVSFETVKKAREITKMPLFVAGGINLGNVKSLADLPIDGVAVISGIMASEDAATSTKNFKSELEKIKKQ